MAGLSPPLAPHPHPSPSCWLLICSGQAFPALRCLAASRAGLHGACATTYLHLRRPWVQLQSATGLSTARLPHFPAVQSAQDRPCRARESGHASAPTRLLHLPLVHMDSCCRDLELVPNSHRTVPGTSVACGMTPDRAAWGLGLSSRSPGGPVGWGLHPVTTPRGHGTGWASFAGGRWHGPAMSVPHTAQLSLTGKGLSL